MPWLLHLQEMMRMQCINNLFLLPLIFVMNHTNVHFDSSNRIVIKLTNVEQYFENGGLRLFCVFLNWILMNYRLRN